MSDSSILHDPGGRVRHALSHGVSGSAVFSTCGRYRHLLMRSWGEGEGTALWVGMNPSTADAQVDDPTVRREIIYSRNRLGCAAYLKANVMDFRATDPKRLLDPSAQPRSDDNLPAILKAAGEAKVVIMAFGALPKALRRFADETVAALAGRGIPLFCVGFTADGSPRHPLYVRGDAPLLPFPRQGTMP